MNRSVRTLWLLLSLAAIGCGAALNSTRVSGSYNGCKTGLFVSVPVPHQVVTVFPESADDRTKLQTQATEMSLPSPTELYVLNYRGALFASKALQVELNIDTTVKHVNINSEAQTEQAFKDLANAAAKAVEANKTASTESDAVASENSSLTTEICNLMLKANRAAIQAGTALPYPDVLSCQ
jgi:hypothetical protein